MIAGDLDTSKWYWWIDNFTAWHSYWLSTTLERITHV